MRDEQTHELHYSKKTEKTRSSLSSSSLNNSRPCIYDFQDFRVFLKTWYEWKKKVHPSYSGALFSRKAGLSSPTLLGMVIRGQRNLSHKSIRAFSKAIELKGKESTYFQNLVLFGQSKSSEDRSYYLEQLHASSQGNGKVQLTRIKDHARFLSKWYVVAIYELVLLDDFIATPEWISKKLKNKISKKQAKDAWELLIKLNLVSWCEEKNKYITSGGMDLDPGTVDFAIRKFHKDFLDRMKDAVDNDPFEDRELSSLTLAVHPSDLPALFKRIKDFRKKLNEEFPVLRPKNPEPRNVIVSVNTQLLILSENPNPKAKEEQNK
ncbi:MAG: hypothetical protein CL678_18860 [Bdellovibrionaceae bacterium]|nr:hypothetical protein [Pseudobdellovibrionaceae bacterium]|tara:strand:- start:6677 stop:7639 length:963 start_codon:yes stop_codon:yes gene_type:complete